MLEYNIISGRALRFVHQRAVVAGYGIVGRLMADFFAQQQVQVSLIEMNQLTYEKQQEQHHQVVLGDVRQAQILTQADIAQADVLALTVPDEDVAIEACRVARELNPEVYIVARTNYFSRGLMASQAGADAVVIEEVVTAHAMQEVMVDQIQSSSTDHCSRATHLNQS